MPKTYYRCLKCNNQVKVLWTLDIPIEFGFCSYCDKTQTVYACQHDYWWERLYMTTIDILRKVID